LGVKTEMEAYRDREDGMSVKVCFLCNRKLYKTITYLVSEMDGLRA